MSEKVKTADEVAEKEINKLVGKAIAKKRLQIRKLEAEIKKLRSGEMSPDEADNESADSDFKKEIIKEHHYHHHHELERVKDRGYDYWDNRIRLWEPEKTNLPIFTITTTGGNTNVKHQSQMRSYSIC